MEDSTEIQDLRQRLQFLEQRDSARHYPAPEQISYIADLGTARAFFLTEDHYSHDWFYPRYRNGRLHEPALTRLMFDSLTPESVMVDVGAHLGYFSVVTALRAKAVFAIEPQEFLIGRIHRNVSANHLRNVTIIHAAAGAETGFVNIPKVGNPTTRIGLSENLVPMIRLDDYFKGPLQPTHMKIDTEGFEYHVLSGASALLAARPVLFIEYHRTMGHFGPTGEEMWTMLNDFGYRIEVGNHRHGRKCFIEVTRENLHRHAGGMLICRPR